jgi:hypothetical protein
VELATPVARYLGPADRELLTACRCSTGARFENDVEAFVQTRLIDYHDWRAQHTAHTIIGLELEELGLVAVGSHEHDLLRDRGEALTGRYLECAAVTLDHQGAVLSDVDPLDPDGRPVTIGRYLLEAMLSDIAELDRAPQHRVSIIETARAAAIEEAEQDSEPTGGENVNRLVQEAVLVGLGRRLAERGSWTGETHLQKTAYLAAELEGIDFDFDFILYKHGPFSFELRDELDAMRAEGLIDSVVTDPRYGAKLVITRRGQALERRFAKTMRRYEEPLDTIASVLGDRGVMDLERLATAMWMTREDPDASVQMRAEALVAIKPHISLDAATSSVEEIDTLMSGPMALTS